MNSDTRKTLPDMVLVPGRPGTARVEYITHRDEVEDMLARGYSARMAYEHLQERYAISCGRLFVTMFEAGESGSFRGSRNPLQNAQLAKSIHL